MNMPSFSTEAYAPDRLIAGDADLITKDVTIISGQNLTRGALLGKITASGKYTLSLSASVDGSEVPVAILAIDTDASGGDKNGGIYLAGEFNEDSLTIGTGHTADSVRDALAQLGIFLKKPVSA